MWQTRRWTSCSSVKFRTEAWIDWFVLHSHDIRIGHTVLSCINHYYQTKPCPNSHSPALSSPEMTSQISERIQQTSDVSHLIMWGILLQTQPLQKNVNAVHARATVCKNFSSGSTFCKRRTYVAASSWMCVDMVPFHLYLFIYLFIWC